MFPTKNARSSQPTKSYQSTQWPLNQAAYKNMANDQVDWAALAQQWILMKDTFTPDSVMPVAPPPPSIIAWKQFEEKGEAPMEVEKDDELLTTSQANTAPGLAPNWTGSAGLNQPPWNSVPPVPGQQWRPNWPPWNANSQPSSTPIGVRAKNPSTSVAAVTLHDGFVRSSPSAGWSASSAAVAAATAVKQYKTVSEHNSPNVSVPTQKQSIVVDNDNGGPEDTTKTIDAAKRKILPAWIREGLEKMEREKIKNTDKEIAQLERNAKLIEQMNAKVVALKELEKDNIAVMQKSKFDSDSDDDDRHADKPPDRIDVVKSKILKHRHAAADYDSGVKQRSHKSDSGGGLRQLAKEEQLEFLMLAVRKNLTEILLEVTNEEIADIADEVYDKFRRKGLGIYEDTSDDSDADSRSSSRNDDKERDSETELAERIQQRKLTFEKISREIEAHIKQEEERELQKRREFTQSSDDSDTGLATASGGASNNFTDTQSLLLNSGGPTIGLSGVTSVRDRDGETQHDKNIFPIGRHAKSLREKKSSRFSDPKDTVRNTYLTHVSIMAPNVFAPKPDDCQQPTPSSSSSASSAAITLAMHAATNAAAIAAGDTAVARLKRDRSTSTASTESHKTVTLPKDERTKHAKQRKKRGHHSHTHRSRRSSASDDSSSTDSDRPRYGGHHHHHRNSRTDVRTTVAGGRRSRTRSRNRYSSRNVSHVAASSSSSSRKQRHRSRSRSENESGAARRKRSSRSPKARY